MATIIHSKALIMLFSLLNFILCSYDIKELSLNQIKYGALKNDESDFYKITLPVDVERGNQVIFEVESNPVLDRINNIVSDPNLYISIDEQHPTDLKNMWSSNRFGDETITLGPQYCNPNQYFFIGVHCREKCNYILRVSTAKNIVLEANKVNSFTINRNTVMKFFFHTKDTFNELNVNVAGSYLKSFNVYLANKEPSSSNTLPAEPMLFNGYKFLVKNNEDKKGTNSGVDYELIVDNRDEKQELYIWLKYDNEIMEIKEAEVTYDSISENKANCYSFEIKKLYENKDIILSTTLFNGLGFMYIDGFKNIEANQVTSSYKDKDNSYSIVQSKAIHLTSKDFQSYGPYNDRGSSYLRFCYYAEKSSSLAIKIYFMENYKKIQKLNEIYPGIKFEDVLPRNSLNRYRMQFFDINNDLTITLKQKSGKTKLYVFMIPPDKNDQIFDLYTFEPYLKSNLVFETQTYFNGHNLFLAKEVNKCTKNAFSSKYNCYLSAIVICESGEDCTYEIFFDHVKRETLMEPKQTYTNVISEFEFDTYSISIKDPSVKNIAIVLTQNTGKSVLRLESFIQNEGIQKLTDQFKSDDFMPGVIKISAKTFNVENLMGTITLAVEGKSYASYSLYYYTFGDEKTDYLDQDKVVMKLEKGKIIKDIFMDDHKFKVYMYDSSTNGNKTDLTAVLVETDDVNSELYIFKDLNDFSLIDGKIDGYLWRGEYKDYVYIDKNDKKYLDNDVLYIMIYKKTESKKNEGFTTFYLGVTDETTPFLLTEGVEFKMQLTRAHKSQKFYYFFRDDGLDLQISFSLFYGHLIVKLWVDKNLYTTYNVIDDNSLVTVPSQVVFRMCSDRLKCPIYIEVLNDDDYLTYSSFLIAARNTQNLPIVLRQGVVNKRTILSGEEQHYIIEIKPDKSFGAKISAFFGNGQGEIYARRVLNSEIYNTTNYPNQLNYEYKVTYKESRKGFYVIDIPYEETSMTKPYKMLITVRGIFPGFYATKIEYSLSISNTLNELVTDKNYRLFISQGEIQHFHFRVDGGKKRLYISMTNKEKDANLFLNYDKYITTISEYQWKNIGGYNEYLDISSEDAFFISHQMNDIDGDYYLAIQGLDDSFYNLYISTQEVKIFTISKGNPAGCTCESENDNCYFRYENINDAVTRTISEQSLIFYTEFTYGSGEIYGRLFPNGDMEEILNNLPTKANHDYVADGSNDFLFVNLDKKNTKYTFSSVVVVGVQCKQRSLFDLSSVILDKTTDVGRTDKSVIFVKINQDNIFYLSKSSGRSSKFLYYISKDQNFNFQVKCLLGKAEIHTYTNDTSTNYKFWENENRQNMNFKNYHHISDFKVDASDPESKDHYGTVNKQYGKGNYMYIEVKPLEDCLININVNYEEDMQLLTLNKEVTGIINKYNYYAYIDFMDESEKIFVTITALDKTKKFNVYIKKNIISKKSGQTQSQSQYSKPSAQNYDIKGTTNDLTSAVSLCVKNVPREMREGNIVRVLINVESEKYSFNQKINVLAAPVINNINRLKPQQSIYYFTSIEKKYADKTLYMLRSKSRGDDLMIIEMSACKGNFIYVLVDSPPDDSETYTDLQKRSVDSNIYSSNGKKIITVRHLEPKEYYLMVYGARNKRSIESIINEENKKNQNENKKEDDEDKAEVELLFYYYTTTEKEYKYLVTKDILNYESIYDSLGVNIQLPELKRRDTFGRENYVDFMNYTLVISEKKVDYVLMESTCYLTKLMQNKNKDYDYIQTKLIPEKKIFNVEGLLPGKTYYMNILAKNDLNGEVITYKPIIFTSSLRERREKIIGIAFLTTVLLVFTILAYNILRKYKIEKAKLSSLEIEKAPDSGFKKKSINLNVVKKKYNTLSEDDKSLNDV